MVNNNEKKDLDQLINSMFRGHRLNTVSAEDYLEQVRKSQNDRQSGLDQAQANQKKAEDTLNTTKNAVDQLNTILRRQSEDLQKQSETLRDQSRDLGFTDQDFAKLQAEVQKDFGISVDVENQQKRQAQDLQAVLNGMQEAAVQTGTVVLGQESFLADLARAFFRPLASGQPEDRLRNVFVISGPKGSGRHLALSTMIHMLAEKHWLANADVVTINGSHYAGSEQEKVFIQDLYAASCASAEVIVIEQAEALYPPFLNQLMKLCQNEEVTLNKRYVLNKGKQLVEAGSSLVTQTVSTLKLTNKYIVFLTTSRKMLMQNFPNSMVEQILDQPAAQPLSPEILLTIYQRLLNESVQTAKKQLNLTLLLDADAAQKRLAILDTSAGALALEKDVRQLNAAINELCLKQPEPVLKVRAEVEQEWAFEVNGQRLAMSDLIRLEKDDLDAIRKEMDAIVGLQEVKDTLRSMEEHYKVAQLRQKQGLKAAPLSRHMIFTGNPGTGKTTMARLVARLFKALGLLSQGQLIEVSRSDLVGRYVGHTAPLTQQIIESALGGVLFIDEAYSLVRGKDDSFGLEAVDTLVKGMEDHRDDLIVILAGYSREMEEFLNANSGLKSRFPNILNFADYTGSELTQIAASLARGKDYVIDESCLNDLTIYFNAVQMNSAARSGNGRLARNTVEKAILNQSRRILNDSQARMDLLLREDFDLEFS